MYISLCHSSVNVHLVVYSIKNNHISCQQIAPIKLLINDATINFYLFGVFVYTPLFGI